MENKEPIVYDEILEPVAALIQEEAEKIEGDAATYKLSFQPFSLNILFAIINGIKSVSLLITHIKSSPLAKKMGLIDVSKSMYSEAFIRYEPSVYRRIFYTLLEKLNFLEIPEIKALGRFFCIDGSVFPAIQTMVWACYKTSANAIKLHLAFELNRMIPVQFFSTEANASERKILLKMLEAGVTYIADRGYVCFQLFHDICEKKAHFIIRGKSNILYEISESLKVDINEKWSSFISDAKDLKVKFKNDKNKREYRLVSFIAMGECFALITDRFDLKTSEVIILYAYRWQVELIFRFLKRTLNGLHLMSHDPRGIEIQFTLYMIGYLLLLFFKQRGGEVNGIRRDEGDEGNKGIMTDEEERCSPKESNSLGEYACGLVSLLGEGLQKYWKIGIHWLSTVRNLLMEPFTPEIRQLIWSEL